MRDIKTFYVLIQQINYILTKKQRYQFVGLFILGLLAAFLETIGVSIMLPFINAIMAPNELFKNKYIVLFLGNIRDEDYYDLFLFLGILIVIVYLFKNSFLLYANYIQTSFRLNFHNKLSIKLLESHLNRPYSYFITKKSSEIIQAILNDTNCVYDTINLIYQLVSQGFIIVFLGIFIAYSDLFMAMVLLVVASFCCVLVTFGFKKKLSDLGRQTRIANQIQYKYLYQAITGNKDIKVMNRGGYFIEHYKAAQKNVNKAVLENSVIGSLPEKVIETVCVCCIIGAVCIRILQGIDVELFVPKLAVFAVAAFKIMPSVSKCLGYLQQLVFYRSAVEAAYNDIKAFNLYEESLSDNYRSVTNNLERNIVRFDFNDKISINNISWTYSDNENKVINNLSLTINKGEAIAFIGRSGAGKTTLADILLGLLQPQSGSVFVDGIDIYAAPGIWSRIIGYVPQDVFLVDDTIRANVAFGVDENDITDDEIWNALEKAQLKQFVSSLKEGLDTIVGERGIKFSGGQRQRIAIARALYHNPEVLVLDEATAALDGKTENALMEAIDNLHGEKTLIIIAHRLSTIRNCDKIYEVKDGNIRERTKLELFGE